MHAWKHFCTITKHRWTVRKHCFQVGLYWQGLTHDLSKYSWTEFSCGAKYFQGTRSPNSRQRELEGFSKAWMHHKGRNRHHFEYWTDYNPKERKVMPVKMPLKYVVEMFCDRVAASKIYQGKNYTDAHPIEYFLRGKPNRVIHPDTSCLLERLLLMLKDEGEEKTFAYIRELLKKKEQY